MVLHGGSEVLRRELLKKGWVLWDETCMGEFEWNLRWRSGRFRMSEITGACDRQKINHFPKSGILTKKDKLLRALRKAKVVFGGVYNFFPQSFILPSEYTKFVKAFSEQQEKKIWICKPDNAARGNGIFLIRDLSELRYGQQYLVQSYIERPLTIGGFKVDLRLYVLVTSFCPLQSFIYSDGLARFGTQKYDVNVNLKNMYAHLTNASINKHSPDLSTAKDVIGAGCKWDLRQLQAWFKETGKDWATVWGRIHNVVALTLLTALKTVQSYPQCFELFGFDIMLDENLKPWIIEVNCSPALGEDCDTDRRVKPSLLLDVVESLHLRQFERKNSTTMMMKKKKQQQLLQQNQNQKKKSASRHRIGSQRRAHSSKGVPRKDGESTPSSTKPFSGGACGGFECLLPFNSDTAKLAGEMEKDHGDDKKVQAHIKSLVAIVRQRERFLRSKDASKGALSGSGKSNKK
eukprot:g1267.t1